MTVTAPTALDWRVGRLRIALPAVVHSIALVSSLELAREWGMAWILVGTVVCSACDEMVVWFRERHYLRRLVLSPGGLQIDSVGYQLRRAWLGPGWTALWLKQNGRRRLLYVVAGEVSPGDHAALRRHAKRLNYDT